jgi:acyl carrier protein
MTIKSEIISVFETVAMEQNKSMPALSDGLALERTGLDSLCFAIIVVRLEDKLGVDPFSSEDEVAFPVTIGDFIALYEYAKA